MSFKCFVLNEVIIKGKQRLIFFKGAFNLNRKSKEESHEFWERSLEFMNNY